MKKLLCFVLSMLMILGLCACSGGEGGEAETPDTGLQAGFARVTCLPDDKIVYIAGGDAAADPSTDGVLDPLAVTAIALKQGGRTILVYTCDIVDIDSFYTTTEKEIAEATGLPVTDIILNATHTHSAPTLKNNLPGKDAYLLKFNAACADAGVRAIADLSPAKMSYGSVMTEHMVRVRHYLMNDGTTYGIGHGSISSGIKAHQYPSDEECQVIRLTRAAADKKDIVLINLGAHATMASGSHTSSLSADFPGYARVYIEDKADVHCAYFIAAAGDQAPSSRIPGEVTNAGNLNAYGAQLGDYVLKVLQNMTDAQGDEIKLYSERYVAKSMKEGADDPIRLMQAMEVVSLKSKYGTYGAAEVKAKIQEYGFGTYYEASGVVSRSKAPETRDLPVTAITIGDVGFVFASYEMFSTHGRQIKDESPMAFTFIITCSEEDQCYIPNDIACEHKFYEYTITRFARGTGEALGKRYCEILTAMKDGTEVPAQQMP